MKTLKELIDEHNHPELAKESGHVYQVWGDGEVTLTKSGDLLGRRGLHCMDMAITPEWAADILPEESNGNTFMYTDELGARAIRVRIAKDYVKYINLTIIR